MSNISGKARYIDLGLASPEVYNLTGIWTYKSYLENLDLESLSVGSTFYLGKYQVESETPWPIEWEIVHQTDNYQIAMTKQIIDCRAFDAKESNNTDSNRKKYGNNNWSVSNIEQFLNSDQTSWYNAQHRYDTPPNSANVRNNVNPYDTHKGFLYYFSDEEKNLLKDYSFTLVTPSNDGGGSYTWTGKVWLPTYTQMGFGNNNIAEGIKFSKFTDNSSRIKSLHDMCIANNEYCKSNNYAGGKKYWYCMSSIYLSYSYYVHSVDYGGSDCYINVYDGAVGFAPCICLPRSNGGVINNTITFKINNVEYKCPRGYSFPQWCNSSYNTDGWYNTGYNITNYTLNKHIKIFENTGYNSINNAIVENTNYEVSNGAIGFQIENVNYYCDAGTTWTAWVTTSYNTIGLKINGTKVVNSAGGPLTDSNGFVGSSSVIKEIKVGQSAYLNGNYEFGE